MTESDRKLLTLACGECWHQLEYDRDEGYYFCNKCGDIPGNINRLNRTFTHADDWELVREKVVLPNEHDFAFYCMDKYYYKSGRIFQELFEWFLSLSIEERCQLACDFIKANLHLFPAVMEYLASLVTVQPSSTQIVSGKKMPWEKMPWEEK